MRVPRSCTIVAFALPLSLLAQKPAIDPGGVKNAASFVNTSPTIIAPQMLVSIFGHNFSNLTFSSTANPFPKQLNGTTVTFAGIAAPILYLSPTQINVQVPSGVQGMTSADVVVTTVAGASAPVTVTVSNGKAMGIFAQGGAGCGQIAAFNVHADGSVAVNTPQNSLDPKTDLGLAIFLTGIGGFADRVDGVPAQFNPADQAPPPMSAQLGIPPLDGFASTFRNLLNISYAGPAPTLVGVDQVNALISAKTAAQGCKVPLFLTDSSSSATQLVNVSIHNGGGACVDPPSDGLAVVTWHKNILTDNGVALAIDSVTIELFNGPQINFAQANSDNTFYVGRTLPNPTVCAASYPSTSDVGNILLLAPQVSVVTLRPQNVNGLTGYRGILPIGTIAAGDFQLSGGITTTAHLPDPIEITGNFKPGTKVPSALTVNWTGGGDDSMVTVQFIIRGPNDTVAAFLSQQTVPASVGSIHFTGLQPATFSAPLPYPTGDVEVIITQEPISGPTQPFDVPGFTLGGRHTWSYVFDFRGLTNQ